MKRRSFLGALTALAAAPKALLALKGKKERDINAQLPKMTRVEWGNLQPKEGFPSDRDIPSGYAELWRYLRWRRVRGNNTEWNAILEGSHDGVRWADLVFCHRSGRSISISALMQYPHTEAW